MQETPVLPAGTADVATQLEGHRRELTGYCYRMLGSPFEAEDAVQETMLRAWRGFAEFEGRSTLRSWLYRIATNICTDMARGRARRAMPMDLGPARTLDDINMSTLPEAAWIEPIPDASLGIAADPAETVEARDSIRLALIAALQHLPPRQRAVLILCEVLRWRATEVAELLDCSVASVTSLLQRARATIGASHLSPDRASTLTEDGQRELLARYVRAFERYDLDALTALIREDATQSMPPYEMWLAGRESIFAFWMGPGIGCRGSRLVAAGSANGSVAFAQYKPNPAGPGRVPWALQVLELAGGGIAQMTFFLDTERIFPLFGLPLRFEALPVSPEGPPSAP